MAIIVVPERQAFYTVGKDGIEQVGGFTIDWTWTAAHAFSCTLDGQWFNADSVEEMVAYIKALGNRVKVMSSAEFSRLRAVTDAMTAAR